MPALVIIRGQVFPAEEKAPFAPSGMSILGGLEYDERADKVKCHECGTWIRGLGQHIKKHGLRRAEYNVKHGLRLCTGLSGAATRKARADATAAQMRDMAALHAAWKPRGKGAKSVESQNESRRCSAQLLYRLQVLAAQQGHTPTVQDMEEAGISPTVVRNRFGNMEKAFRRIGLQSNNGAGPSPLPMAFPTESEIKKRWKNDQRMPWPKDYFGIDIYRRRDD